MNIKIHITKFKTPFDNKTFPWKKYPNLKSKPFEDVG